MEKGHQKHKSPGIFTFFPDLLKRPPNGTKSLLLVVNIVSSLTKFQAPILPLKTVDKV